MKLRTALALIAISLLISIVARTDSSADTHFTDLMSLHAASGSAKSATPVLVELFTSEGCSSCPPADKLLAQLNARQPVQGAEAIILEEHVDYWDDLGWRDPFASAEATKRQRDYSRTLHAKVYTPQMIVDGRMEILGGDEYAAQNAITRAVAAPKTELELSWVGMTNTMGGPKLLRVRAGKLSAGENAGRGLEHDGVVRKLTSLGKTNGTGEFSFDAQSAVKLSPDWKRENIRVVVFVQDVHSRRIYAATSTPY